MTRMTGPDCVVMCNLINTYIHTYIHTFRMGEVWYGGRKVQIGAIKYSTHKYTTTIFFLHAGEIMCMTGVRNMLLLEWAT